MFTAISRSGVLAFGALLIASCDSPRHESSSGDVAATVGQTAPASATTARVDSASASSAERSPRRVVINGVDLTGVGYDRGSDSASVVVVNFSDFGCPYCGSFARETEPAIEREYVETGKVFLKHVPFVAGMFPNSRQAARAAECAGEQGKFWPMHDRLYATQKEWKPALSPYALFQKHAASIGLDAARFSTCYTGEALHPRTRQATEAADRLGVRVTPSFIVNGRPVEGALPLAQFRVLLDAALGRD